MGRHARDHCNNLGGEWQWSRVKYGVFEHPFLSVILIGYSVGSSGGFQPEFLFPVFFSHEKPTLWYSDDCTNADAG
jgi:hypothetical protein